MAAVGTNNIAIFGQFICAVQALNRHINPHYLHDRRYWANQLGRYKPGAG